MTRTAVLLLGDSHLARLGADVPPLDAEVINRAVGGASTRGLPGQLEGLDVTVPDVAVVSVGTNDAAPWKRVPTWTGRQVLADLVALLPCPVVLLAPPGVDESRLTRREDRTVASMAAHAASLAEPVLSGGGRVVDTPRVLAPLGPAAFLTDGVHLTPEAYGLVLAALRDELDDLLAGAPGT